MIPEAQVHVPHDDDVAVAKPDGAWALHVLLAGAPVSHSCCARSSYTCRSGANALKRASSPRNLLGRSIPSGARRFDSRVLRKDALYARNAS